MRLRWQATLHGACALALVGCLTEQRYHVLGGDVELTADTPPAYFTEDDEPIYRVDEPFSLRITSPSAAELARLTREVAGEMTSYPRLPWVALHDLSLQLDYALTNDSERALTALVFVNGVNEFQYYAPVEEDYNQWERRVVVAPHQRITGTITELELDELAIDLATVVNGAPNSNLVVDRNSQSSRDPRVQPYAPAVVPGLVGVRAGIETTVAEHVLLELTIRVVDHEDRAQPRGDRAWMLPEAAPFTPLVPEEE
ncbi:MAG TPA: hypothetical protein VFX59_03530 [Polyangiales bacterium]|nr:hypothetical protein [Polyangiales bacterium]